MERRGIYLSALGLLALLGAARTAKAQFALQQVDSHFELSDSVEVADVPNEASTLLARVDALLADEKWDEAVETLRRVAADYGEHVIAVSEQEYINVRDFCHRRIAALPPAALDLYRRRVDDVAESWYREGIERRDRDLLQRIVDQQFCSRWGDDALLALGEMALEQGHTTAARWYWERISPRMRTRDGHTVWSALAGLDLDKHRAAIRAELTEPVGTPTWLAYPDTDLDLAQVRARLVLVSIREGEADRARLELEVLRQLHPDAEGHLAGTRGNYGAMLTKRLAESLTWPSRPEGVAWPTFAGSPERSRVLSKEIAIPPTPRWQLAFDQILPKRRLGSPRRGRQIHRGAESDLAFHPLIVDGLVLLNSRHQIFALKARTGKPAFGEGPSAQIYPGGEPTAWPAEPGSRSPLSEPRYTMTAFGGRLYVRMGSQVTLRPPGRGTGAEGNRLVCLDLKRQGALQWQVPRARDRAEFDRARWAFEGPPVVDREGLYVAMRRGESRAEAHIACFDPETGDLRWRRRICVADTPMHGQQNEMTHNLLTLSEGVLYYNSNLGAIASLTAKEGQVRWIVRYPRAKSGDLTTPPAHFYRDLNPCIVYQGQVIAAPSDSDRIFSLDAGTGKLVWRIAPTEVHPVHLLGVGQGYLIATGKSIWWFHAVTGRAEYVWPEPGNRNADHGYGRGVLAGGNIYWPTRERIFVFDQKVFTDGGRHVAMKQFLSLARPDLPTGPGPPFTGGNLVVGDGMLLIATAKRLLAYDLREPLSETANKQ